MKREILFCEWDMSFGIIPLESVVEIVYEREWLHNATGSMKLPFSDVQTFILSSLTTIRLTPNLSSYLCSLTIYLNQFVICYKKFQNKC